MIIRELVYSCINVLLPADCQICRIHTIQYPASICQRCKNTLIAGKIPPLTSSTHISKIFSCRSYTNVTEKCIKQFKYRHTLRIINAFDQIIKEITNQNKSFLNAIDLIIPVPIHKARRQRRGFNQSEIIAKNLSNISLIPISGQTLVKTKNTAPQTNRNKKNRINNIKNSFSVLKPSLVFNKSIMLVDDVMTTGATLDECAKELLRAGAKEIKGFTLARVL